MYKSVLGSLGTASGKSVKFTACFFCLFVFVSFGGFCLFVFYVICSQALYSLSPG